MTVRNRWLSNTPVPHLRKNQYSNIMKYNNLYYFLLVAIDFLFKRVILYVYE